MSIALAFLFSACFSPLSSSFCFVSPEIQFSCFWSIIFFLFLQFPLITVSNYLSCALIPFLYRSPSLSHSLSLSHFPSFFLSLSLLHSCSLSNVFSFSHLLFVSLVLYLFNFCTISSFIFSVFPLLHFCLLFVSKNSLFYISPFCRSFSWFVCSFFLCFVWSLSSLYAFIFFALPSLPPSVLIIASPFFVGDENRIYSDARILSM